MNYLLPHIRRIPEELARAQFAADAAQKLGIDSAVLREELRQAALRRRDHIEVRATALTEVERVLLRALAIIDPEHQQSRRIAADAVLQQPAWFEQLGVFPALQALAARQASDPMEVGRRSRPSGRCWPRPCSAKPSLPQESEVASRHPADPGAGDREPAARAARRRSPKRERRGDFAELAAPHCSKNSNWTGPSASCTITARPATLSSRSAVRQPSAINLQSNHAVLSCV